MADNRFALLEMAEKGGDVDFLRMLVHEIVQQLMEAKADSMWGDQRH
nr:hypothetical protein [Halorhodospira halophila]